MPVAKNKTPPAKKAKKISSLKKKPVVEKFNFGDLRGPVPATRHANGGGWVAKTAKVAKTCYVGPKAKVYGYAVLEGNVRVEDRANVFGDACLHGNVVVKGRALVSGDAALCDDVKVMEDACVSGNFFCRRIS